MKLIQRLKQLWLSSLLLICSNCLFAESMCHVVLAPGTNLLWLKNTSLQGYWVNHPTSRPMSAGWASWLDPGKYSVLVVQQTHDQPREFLLSTDHFSCPEVLQVYTFSPKAWHFSGDYWVTENQGFFTTLFEVLKRGTPQLGHTVGLTAVSMFYI